MLQELSRALAAVAEALPQVPKPLEKTQTVGREQLRDALLRLQQAISRGGLDDQALSCLTEGLQGAQQKKALDHIRQALDDFDFELAQQSLTELLHQLHDEDSQTP